ncbi:MAG: phosphatidate cytidylyltransferase [Actinomycetota bacterium]|nr:phosphatidate cytidylyltransferase [Actinomycetota bacterium]
MPRDPFAQPLFQPTASRIGLLLFVALVLVIVVERKPPSRWRGSVLFQKVGSWAVMAPIFALSVFTGGFVSLGLVVYMSIQAIIEYGKLVKLARPYLAWLIGYGVFGLIVTAYFGHRFFLFMPIGFFAVATLIPLTRLKDPHADPRTEVMQAAASVLGYIWIAVFLSFFVLIARTEKQGVALLLLLGTSVALSDVLAFTVGKIAKGPKIRPSVSPNKTWAGAAGNVVGAYLAFWLMSFAIPGDLTKVTVAVVPLVIGLGALWGDMVESLVKRAFDTKDAGDLLPGFGGLLDRIDSLLVAMPLGYYAIKVIQHYSATPY